MAAPPIHAHRSTHVHNSILVIDLVQFDDSTYAWAWIHCILDEGMKKYSISKLDFNFTSTLGFLQTKQKLQTTHTINQDAGNFGTLRNGMEWNGTGSN